MNCNKNSSGEYRCNASTPGYLKDPSSYYNINYTGKTFIKSSINTGTTNQNDCSESVGGLIQPYGEGPVYFCVSSFNGVEFFNKNELFLLDKNLNVENIFANTTGNEDASFAIRAYSQEKYSGFIFDEFTYGEYCVNSGTSIMSKDGLFCKSSILINKYECEGGLCHKTGSSSNKKIRFNEYIIFIKNT